MFMNSGSGERGCTARPAGLAIREGVMKRILLAISVSMVLLACSGGSSDGVDKDVEGPTDAIDTVSGDGPAEDVPSAYCGDKI